MQHTTSPLRKLMVIVAHPDDESLATGGVLARYAAEGAETSLLVATRGERGWFGDPRAYPGPAQLGQIREAELRAAAEVLSVRHIEFLNYIDGDLDQADPSEAIAGIVGYLRQVRPQVVITFGPDGIYGHPDHIAISQFTTAAVMCAADPGYPAAWDWPAHRVSKLYYQAFSQAHWAAYQAAFGDVMIAVDGVERRFPGWNEWMLTTHIDTTDYWRQVWRAVSCHRTQLPGYTALLGLPEARHRALWGTQYLYRAFSTVNGGRAVERDLFEGLE